MKKTILLGSLLGLGLILNDNSFSMETNQDGQQPDKQKSTGEVKKEDGTGESSNEIQSIKMIDYSDPKMPKYSSRDDLTGIQCFKRIRKLEDELIQRKESESESRITEKDVFFLNYPLMRQTENTLKTHAKKLEQIKDKNNISVVQVAIHANCPNVVSELLNFWPKVDVNSASDGGLVPPIMAALRVGNPDIVDILLRHGARLVDENGKMLSVNQVSILSSAIDGGMIQYLIDKDREFVKNNINCGGGNSETVLTYAARNNKTEAFELLFNISFELFLAVSDG